MTAASLAALENHIDGLYASLSDRDEIPADRRARLEADLRASEAQLTAAQAAPAAAPTLTFKDFVLAGKAIFTVSNPTGEHYTFKVRAWRKHEYQGFTYFVDLLTGPQNTSDYTYLGKLIAATGEVVLTAKSSFNETSKPVKVVAWALAKVWAGQALPTGYAIQHAGRCGRCARLLTDPTSIELGIGPECRSQMGF